MIKTLGFIGAGNMAQAFFRRFLQDGLLDAAHILISDVNKPLTDALHAELGVRVSSDNVSLVRDADAVMLAVKPIYCAAVLREIREALGETPLLSIVTGWTLPMLQDALRPGAHLLRVMPNTPVMVGEGMTLLGESHTLTAQEMTFAQRIFADAGRVQVLEDRLFNAATAISGCGPAFVYQIIEALGDAGVMHGVPRAMAYQLAAQMVMGAGKMVLESGQHPAALKDAVCSPGGTTIQGVFAMEKAGVRAAMINAVTDALTKTEALSEAAKKEKA